MIASLRSHQLNCRLVTWTGKWINEAELPLTKELAQYLGFEHSYLDYSNFEGSNNWVIYQELSKLNKGVSKPNLSSKMKSSLAAAMAQAASPGETFIRGWGGGFLRGFYNIHNQRRRIDQHNPHHLAKLYLTNRVDEPNPYFYQFTVQAFEKFIVRANYTDDFYYLDSQDLFYWEQRMGMWGASWLNAMDPAIYTITGMNSRTLYAASFGLPPASRNTPELLDKITARHDKELVSIGKQTMKPTATSSSLPSGPRNITKSLDKITVHQDKKIVPSGKQTMKPTRDNIYQKSVRSINFSAHQVLKKKVGLL